MKKIFSSSFNVTTEGDCEGRSVNHLGTFTGYLDEIAFYLGNKAMYGLEFEMIKPIKVYKPTVNEVNVSFGIDSGTWDMDSDKRITYFKKLLKQRKGVTVEDSNYYACVKLIRK